MNKKLPNVFVKKQKKEINNNMQVFYGKNEPNETHERGQYDEIIVRKKINDIFSSPSFVYKIKVKITTSSGSNIVELIGKNYNSLILIDGSLINKNEILDIEQI